MIPEDSRLSIPFYMSSRLGSLRLFLPFHIFRFRIHVLELEVRCIVFLLGMLGRFRSSFVMLRNGMLRLRIVLCCIRRSIRILRMGNLRCMLVSIRRGWCSLLLPGRNYHSRMYPTADTPPHILMLLGVWLFLLPLRLRMC